MRHINPLVSAVKLNLIPILTGSDSLKLGSFRALRSGPSLASAYEAIPIRVWLT